MPNVKLSPAITGLGATGVMRHDILKALMKTNILTIYFSWL